MKFMKNGQFVKIGVTAFSAITAMTFQAFGYVIDFDSEGYTGPDAYAFASPIPQTIPITVGGVTVTFSGGVILTDATSAPGRRNFFLCLGLVRGRHGESHNNNVFPAGR